MTVRARLAAVKQWIGDRIGDLVDGKTPRPEKTFAFWWMRNSEEGEDFTRNDAVVEVLHDFMAISQWGNMIYEIMLRLAPASGDPEIRASFKKTMESDSDDASAETFAPLTRFVMELFRTISPNRGSLSALEAAGSRPDQTFNYIVIPHAAHPAHWQRPETFDPDRFKKAPTSHQIDEAKCAQVGLAKCPF